ncbi:hypothetical protein ATCC90586_002933 [Pythium insidiosum]|nr:hypothetical protein ATCC90586_002933 [Pythium insidiosum]
MQTISTTIVALLVLASMSPAAAALPPAAAGGAACPPTGFTSKSVFNAAKYFDGRWYAIRQTPVIYQPVNELFCVTADYKLETTSTCKVFRCKDTVVRVDNAANVGGITGPRKKAGLNGVIKDASRPAEASVGPRFLPSFLYGSYWVIEAGSFDDLLAGKTQFTSDNYEWAIITGGKPEVSTPGGCLPGDGPLNGRGFWLFSRKPVVSSVESEKLVALAASKGLDVSALRPVVQDGCRYQIVGSSLSAVFR